MKFTSELDNQESVHTWTTQTWIESLGTDYKYFEKCEQKNYDSSVSLKNAKILPNRVLVFPVLCIFSFCELVLNSAETL